MGRRLNLKLLAIETTFSRKKAKNHKTMAQTYDMTQLMPPQLIPLFLTTLFTRFFLNVHLMPMERFELGVYADKAFIETENSNGKEAKDTWLSCQGYTFEADPEGHTSVVITSKD